MGHIIRYAVVLLIAVVFLLIVAIVVTIYTLLVQTSATTTVAESFKANAIVPDAVPVAPQGLVSVTFPSGAEVMKGNIISPSQAQDVPTVSWQADPCAFYTLAMTDPDAPSRVDPTNREYLHWLVGNILGNNVASGEVLATYNPIAPSQGTGLHRYVFLVYEQPGQMDFDEPGLFEPLAENRFRFSIAKFAEKHNFSDPIDGNFFQATGDI